MTKVAGFVLAVALLPALIFAKGTTHSSRTSHHKTVHHTKHIKATHTKTAHKKAPVHTAAIRTGRIKKVSHTTARTVHTAKVSSVESNFQKSYPCPSNKKTSGSCPGYVVDHVTPLDQGGANTPDNMQWRPVEAETPHA